MNITVFGSGYVGLVAAACFAEVGNNVVCVDIDKARIENLKKGIIPIYEQGLTSTIRKSIDDGLLHFTNNVSQGVEHGLFIFISVGTPEQADGSVNLDFIESVATSIGEHINDYKIVISKSTVPVGTSRKVKNIIQSGIDKRNVDVNFDVVSNPEFLREGSAIKDFSKPDRIIIGTENQHAEKLLRVLYKPFNRNHDRIITMGVESAELTKYAANSMLALKVSFINEIANIAEHVGADIEQVRVGIGSDQRIGYDYIYPGVGYGGSCFPKDVRGLVSLAKNHHYNAELINSIDAVNNSQKKSLFNKVNNFFQGDLDSKVIAIWGLSFKPNTDDIREAPSRIFMELCWEHNVKIQAYDPEAMEKIGETYGIRNDLSLCQTKEDALAGADCLVLMTDWQSFKSPDFKTIKSKLKSPVIFDGRNQYDPEYLKQIGFNYFSIGR